MEAHLVQLGQGLVRRGVRVAAICSPRPELQPMRLALSEAGVRVHELEDRGGSPLGVARRLRDLVRTLRQYPGCILHLHLGGYGGADLQVLAGRMAGARAIVRTEHMPPMPPITRRDRIWIGLRDRLLAGSICVSEQNRREHVERLGRAAHKLAVVPNCVDLERFSPRVRADGVHAELGLDPSAPIVGVVSRLSEARKGLDYFMEMAAVVARAHPCARFLVVGDGPLRPDLEHQAGVLGIEDRIVFAGERHDVPRLLAAMRVFVMPSLYEGGPYTLLEAMAMATPVVSTPVGLASSVVSHGVSGLLVPIADSRALAEATLALLTDEKRAAQLGRAGREVVAARFSHDVMIDGVLAVYRRIAGGAPVGASPVGA
jgi:glycosyltransferase involved in cell wall biosynthesis